MKVDDGDLCHLFGDIVTRPVVTSRPCSNVTIHERNGRSVHGQGTVLEQSSAQILTKGTTEEFSVWSYSELVDSGTRDGHCLIFVARRVRCLAKNKF